MPHTLHVISHTHWDREWFQPFQHFRMRLVDLVDHLLDLLERDPDFHCFHLDAQTIVLEDYLTIRPQQRDRLEGFIRAGRITIGPWYQLNDEFLTSGEATIRSLLVGTRIARQFGACLSIGYLPDQFGNLSQMPQIFRGFGIDNAIFGRGYQLVDDRKMEFLWEAPDGSQVTASLMAFWYNNAQHFPADPREALQYTQDLLARMTPVSAVSHLLLMNGVDHLEPQQDLSPILAGLRKRLPGDVKLLHSTIQDYMDAVKAEVKEKGIRLEVQRGELREDRGGSILAGTLSTRIYLKQANAHAQTLLERYAEPLAAFAMLSGETYPYDFLYYAWKLLMQNHPHDSICGCSIDAVHREMLTRFAQVEQIGAELVARSMDGLAARVRLPGPATVEAAERVGLVVFNPLSWPRTDPLRASLVFPLGVPARGNPPRDDRLQWKGLRLSDDAGAEIPFAVAGMEIKMRQVISPVELPLDQWVQEYQLEFIAGDVPACGYKTFRAVRQAEMPAYADWEDESVSNWEAVFEDCGEVGDEYLHKKTTRDQQFERAVCDTLVQVERNAVRNTSIYSYTWSLPAAASADGNDRSAERADCRVTSRVTRWRDCPRTEFTVDFDNQARDHRVRMRFQSREPFQARPVSIAEGQFDVLRRPLVHPLADEGASTFHPQQNWVALEGESEAAGVRTVAVLNQGLPEYEVYPMPGGAQIAVTLLRGVNYISRRGDGPQLETPEAQCLGANTYNLALLETPGNWEAGLAWQQALQFNAPLRAVQTAGESSPQPLPARLSFLTLDPPALVLSALKRAEDEPDRIILRFYNISDQAVPNGRVRLRGATAAAQVNLNEEQPQPLDLRPDGTVELGPVRPKEIVTLAFQFR
jgi:alpha-mannosidase